MMLHTWPVEYTYVNNTSVDVYANKTSVYVYFDFKKYMHVNIHIHLCCLHMYIQQAMYGASCSVSHDSSL